MGVTREIGCYGVKMKISRTLEYAIRATLELSQSTPTCPISCREVARRGDMPERFLIQILHSLTSSGVLRSVQGVSGGYYLARPPESITFLDIVASFDDPNETMVPVSPRLPWGVRQRLADILAAARLELGKLTIADLVSDSASTGPDE
jgi:Rrf2 family transcriptional regulator, cysteine metabolism repressor